VPQRPKADFLRRLPENVTVVDEIRRFLSVTKTFQQGQVELANGTVSVDFLLINFYPILLHFFHIEDYYWY
jgi:hypothetical protein